MSKKIVVKCSDTGNSFEVEEAVAMQSGVLKNLLDDGFGEFEVHQVSSHVMLTMIRHCRNRANAKDEEELKKFDSYIVDSYNPPYASKPQGLIEIMRAADYMAIENLVDLTCQTLADLISYKTPLGIRSFLKIKGDNTPEEEAKAVAWKR